MHTEEQGQPNKGNVVDIFSKRSINEAANKVIRLAPELDGLEMLYTNDSAPEKLYSLKIVCWALREDGEVVGMVPWLNEIVPCTEIDDPLNGHWEGYRDPGVDDIFFVPPQHKIVELESSAEYYKYQVQSSDDIIQEIPDTIGTHAVLTDDGFRSFQLVEVVSWQLRADGNISGMLIEEEKIRQTPVLVGDECLYAAESHTEFKYYFQHRIANKIKERDPEALAAISLLIES